MRKGLKILLAGFAALLALALAASCGKEGGDARFDDYERVMIMVSAGRNSLSANLLDDLRELQEGYVPAWNEHKALVIISHNLNRSYVYADATEAYVIRLVRGRSGQVFADTLKRYPETTVLTDKADFEAILRYVGAEFPSKHYGMVYSSHGWGFLPKGYYNHRDELEKDPSFAPARRAPRASVRMPSGAFPYVPDAVDGEPRTKSVGQEVFVENGATVAYEMDIADFAAAIPYHLDYMIFDACLMGGVETAWVFRDKADRFIGSQAEIVSDGLDYQQLASRLLEGDAPDLEGVCQDFYDMYKYAKGWRQTATVSLVDTGALDPLAAVCKPLFAKYRTDILALQPGRVQHYYSGEHPWYFDLKDVLIQAGATQEELARLQNALDGCVLFKRATPRVLDLYDVTVFSGLSMYLPSVPGEYLRSYYRQLGWNQASGLVE